MTEQQKNIMTLNVPVELAGKRIDQVIAHCLSDYSRSRIQQWFKSNHIFLDGQNPKPKEKVWGGELIEIHLQDAMADVVDERWDPQEIPLNIIYEDESVIVINKPAGLVVHPGAGNMDGTMVNALLHHAPELAQIPRAGVIHRLDKDTSGILVVTRTLSSHNKLTQQLQAREFNREYQAFVLGVMTAGGTIDEPIGRHPTHRTRMAVLKHGSTAKEAITHYRVEQRYRAHTLVNVKLETGRTHQIRVHMAYIKYPIVGDPVYAGRSRIPPNSSQEFIDKLREFRRQALHARTLGFIHPETDEYVEWTVEMPKDMQDLRVLLEEDQKSHDEQ